jgi:uncharacterized protein (DUF2147 family)
MLHCPRKLVKSAVLLSVLLPATYATSALAADPTGDWLVADGVANIRVAQCNGSMWGVVAWEKQPGGRDSNNPDPAKQSRPTIGMPILLDMKKKPGADSWEGQVYNAKDGQTYSSSITPIDADHLEIKGCVLGFLCGGETWTRVAPPIRRPRGLLPPQPRANLRPPTPSAISAYSPISRGLPISAGWNSSTAARVVTSESASSLPMLDVPGWLESHRLPNAVAVVSALKKIARVREDCSRFVLPDRHATM